jgi:hypothetical protein
MILPDFLVDHADDSKGINPLDVVRVGDPPDLPLQSTDPENLLSHEIRPDFDLP